MGVTILKIQNLYNFSYVDDPYLKIFANIPKVDTIPIRMTPLTPLCDTLVIKLHGAVRFGMVFFLKYKQRNVEYS